MNEYELHSGLIIPNFSNDNPDKLPKGLYAIEPFATNGSGKIYEGKPSGIYALIEDKNIRSNDARDVLDFIVEEYKTLPFCSRWVVKKFGTKSLFALRELENNNTISQFDQLVEVSHKPVSQAEHTILIEKEKVTITTE
jgi:methionyl aminopeptidase